MKKILQPEDIADTKQILISIVSMLVGLIKAVAPGRVYEGLASYRSDLEAEQEQVNVQD